MNYSITMSKVGVNHRSVAKAKLASAPFGSWYLRPSTLQVEEIDAFEYDNEHYENEFIGKFGKLWDTKSFRNFQCDFKVGVLSWYNESYFQNQLVVYKKDLYLLCAWKKNTLIICDDFRKLSQLCYHLKLDPIKRLSY